MRHIIVTRVKHSAGAYSVRICGKNASSTASAEAAIRRAIEKRADGMIDRLKKIERATQTDPQGWSKFTVEFSDTLQGPQP